MMSRISGLLQRCGIDKPGLGLDGSPRPRLQIRRVCEHALVATVRQIRRYNNCTEQAAPFPSTTPGAMQQSSAGRRGL